MTTRDKTTRNKTTRKKEKRKYQGTSMLAFNALPSYFLPLAS
jgi:hypothetical protein